MDRCHSEFDITMTDRINALLNPPIFTNGSDPLSQRTPVYNNQTDSCLVYKMDTEISCPELIFKLRFA